MLASIDTLAKRLSPDAKNDEPGLEHWLRQALNLVQKYRLNPLRASRALSYIAAGMHDAGAAASSPEFACEVAGSELAGFFFPDEPAGLLRIRLVERGANLRFSAMRLRAGWNAGQGAAQITIKRALDDGADPGGAALQPPRDAQRFPYPWKATPPLWASRPTEPLAPRWRAWLVAADIADATPAPPVFDGERYRAEITEVLAVHRSLSAEQKKIADDWNLDLGTVTPAGVWMLKMFALPQYQRLPANERTACASLLATTMLDAFIACWRVKYRWWTERPVTAIRRELDPTFLPHLVTPGFPSYVSGHASVSGAAATVLAACFPELAASLQKEAEQAAMSRLYGGIHFRADNDAGLELGRRVGALAIEAVARGR